MKSHRGTALLTPRPQHGSTSLPVEVQVLIGARGSRHFSKAQPDAPPSSSLADARGLCTCCSLCLECSSLGHLHRSLPHDLQSFTRRRPPRTGLPGTTPSQAPPSSMFPPALSPNTPRVPPLYLMCHLSRLHWAIISSRRVGILSSLFVAVSLSST